MNNERIETMKIGIVGLGVIGSVLYQVLNDKYKDVKRRDPAKGYNDRLTDTDVIFICVNDESKDMKLINTIVGDIVKENKKAIIVLRTTILPGTTDALILKHKRKIVFMPEFLIEKKALEDMREPDKVVIGTENNEAFIVLLRLMTKIVLCNYYIRVRPIEAELAKLVLNSLATIKVVFAEEMYDLSEALGADYNNVYKIIGADKNINKRHLMANKNGYRGAGGKCLPKDIGFLCDVAKKKYMSIPLVSLAKELNIHYSKMKSEV